MVAKTHAVLAGVFENSNRAISRYAGYAWRPVQWPAAGLDIAAGIAVAAFDGYPNYRGGDWFIAPLPVLTVEGERFGVNLSVIPTVRNRLDGAFAVQLKVRVQ